MKVQDIMYRDVRSCHPDTNLAEIALVMWNGDCGIVPVVDGDNRVLGVITDRDICIAAAMKHRRPDDITAGEVINEGQRSVYTASMDDEIHDALDTLSVHKIRRLPVVDPSGRLAGMISMNDMVLGAQELKLRKGITPAAGISNEDVVETFKAICSHRQPAVAA